MSGLEAVLVATTVGHFYFQLDPARCGGCRVKYPCEGEPMDEHAAHVAGIQAAAVREWAQGRAGVAAEALWRLEDRHADSLGDEPTDVREGFTFDAEAVVAALFGEDS